MPRSQIPAPVSVAMATTENSNRRLQDGLVDNGEYEIASKPVVYFNGGTEGTGEPEIAAPTIVILFEHDDVTGIVNQKPILDDIKLLELSAPYGSVEVSHYYGGCRTEIESSTVSSTIGERILDPSTDFAKETTGLGLSLIHI